MMLVGKYMYVLIQLFLGLRTIIAVSFHVVYLYLHCFLAQSAAF